jgi:hypothetical protein
VASSKPSISSPDCSISSLTDMVVGLLTASIQ